MNYILKFHSYNGFIMHRNEHLNDHKSIYNILFQPIIYEFNNLYFYKPHFRRFKTTVFAVITIIFIRLRESYKDDDFARQHRFKADY